MECPTMGHLMFTHGNITPKIAFLNEIFSSTQLNQFYFTPKHTT